MGDGVILRTSSMADLLSRTWGDRAISGLRSGQVSSSQALVTVRDVQNLISWAHKLKSSRDYDERALGTSLEYAGFFILKLNRGLGLDDAVKLPVGSVDFWPKVVETELASSEGG